ncbi:hypothetical protein SDC9_137391 [bioreactor metagenome]|uniref:Uncharacterized protein n=1 Tax=bioreactor metagenome TaxID=1076179 RepID=A0A645DLE9_9ZZZZ
MGGRAAGRAYGPRGPAWSIWGKSAFAPTGGSDQRPDGDECTGECADGRADGGGPVPGAVAACSPTCGSGDGAVAQPADPAGDELRHGQGAPGLGSTGAGHDGLPRHFARHHAGDSARRHGVDGASAGLFATGRPSGDGRGARARHRAQAKSVDGQREGHHRGGGADVPEHLERGPPATVNPRVVCAPAGAGAARGAGRAGVLQQHDASGAPVDRPHGRVRAGL